jgi:flagellin FlaB
MGFELGVKIKWCRKNTYATVGIGAMIVFIAMVLVAGIAASILVQTSSQLEMRALSTGHETITEVASGLRVSFIEGYNSSGVITKMAVEITGRAGTPDIDLSQAVIEISDSSNKYVLGYGGAVCNSSSIDGSIFEVTNFGDAYDFDLIVLQDADNSCISSRPIINYGDHVIIAINTSSVFNGLAPRTDVNGLIIIEEGAPGIIGFTTPSSYADITMELQ